MKHSFVILLAFFCLTIAGWSQTQSFGDPTANSGIRFYNDNNQRLLLKSTLETASMPDSAHSSRYDTTNLNFKLFQRTFYSYDSGGMMIQKRIISTDKNGNWRNYSNDTMLYIGSQLRVVISKQWDSQNSIWKNSLKNDYYYDTLNVLTSIILSSWNAASLNWETSEKQSFEYTASGLLQQELHQSWNSTLSIWNNSSRSVFSYSGSRLENSRQELWDDVNLAWKNYYRSSYSYANNLNTEILTEKFNTTWENTAKMIFTYTSAGKTETETMQTWNGSNWVNSTALIHTYTNDDRVKTLTRQWQAHLNDWRDFNQDETFFSIHDVFGRPEMEGLTLHIQNPVRKGSQVRLNGLPDNQLYSMQLYSITGKLVLMQKLYANDLILIPSHLASGIYLLNIRGINQGIRLLVTD